MNRKKLPTREDFKHDPPNYGYYRQAYLEALEEWAKEANILLLESNANSFEQASRPLIKWLCENEHPHVTAIITPTSCELLEGKSVSIEIFDYVRD